MLGEHIGNLGNMMGTQWVQQKAKKGDECTFKGGICQF